MTDYPYSEFHELSNTLKAMPPFVFPAPGPDDDHDEWANFNGTFPCPSLEPGTEFGVITHSKTALRNAYGAPDIKMVNMRSLAPDLISAYVANISESHLDPAFAENCIKDADLVLFALDASQGGSDGVAGLIAANVSDLEAPLLASGKDQASMHLHIGFEFVHVKESYRGFGIGTTMAASLGYDLGLSLSNLLGNNYPILKELDTINAHVTYESEFMPGVRAANALCMGFTFMACFEDTLFDLAAENGDNPADMMGRGPAVYVEPLNEH